MVAPAASAKVPIPPREGERLAALRAYQILDTPAQRSYDDITELASQICGTPIAAISLVDTNRQWFKSRLGLRDPETPRAGAFCGWTILTPTVNVVPDARVDERFREAPLVVRGPRVRSYAGAPLLTPALDAVGALCVMDTVPREFSARQLGGLEVLAHQVMVQLELRRTLFELADLVDKRRAAELEVQAQATLLRSVFQSSPLGLFTMDLEGRVTSWNPAAERLFGWSETEVLGQRNPIVPPDREAEFLEHLEVVLGGDTFIQRPLTRRGKDGAPVRVVLSAAPIVGPEHEIRGLVALVARDGEAAGTAAND